MSDIAISVKNVSKEYLYTESTEQSGGMLSGISNSLSSHSIIRNTKALNNVSFTIYKGEIVGIVGKNGAGKSTLLNVLSQITPPTSGVIEFNGTVTSILGIGAGFHPELSGRENVFLNGAILGFQKKIIEEGLDDIIEFSGLRDFIDTPVKFYSSGMYLRLAFSIFAKLTSDILLLDEVLSVGDAAFRKKCVKLITEIAAKGATIVLVSHDISDVLRLCTRCIYLENGEMVMQGPPKSTSEFYLEGGMEENEDEDDLVGKTSSTGLKAMINQKFWAEVGGPKGEEFRLNAITVNGKNKAILAPILRSDDIEVSFDIDKLDSTNSIQIGLHLTNLADIWVLCSSHSFEPDFQSIGSTEGGYRIKTVIPANILNAGVYSIGLTVSKNDFEVIGQWERLLKFRVELEDWEKQQIWASNQAIIRPNLNWEVQKLAPSN